MTESPIDIHRQQQAFFHTGTTLPPRFRKEQLKKLISLFRQEERKIEEALFADLRKHPQEVYMTELVPVYDEFRTQLKNLDNWMRPQRVNTPVYLQPSSSHLYPQPLGTVLIISPWNYPFNLSFRAMAGAIAAGNTIMLKPSEHSAHTSEWLKDTINKHFPKEYLYVMNGQGSDVLPPLLEQCHFGKIFFTGGTFIGSKIMEMAAKQLSPVSLELGGKSPCIIDETAPIQLTARRIVWGKFLNCGQTCLAPDYLAIHESIKEPLINAIIAEIKKAYGTETRNNPDYGRIIHDRRYQVLKSYLQEGTILYGGDFDDQDRYIGPTLMDHIQPDSRIMKEEIFGPILPVFTFRKKEEVLELIAKNPYPLALYLFSNDRKTQDLFIERVPFGGGCINDTVLHIGNTNLPFGGIGTSGTGGHLGKYSFDLFSHYKGIVKKKNWFEPAARFAPFSPGKFRFWRWMIGQKWL